MSGKLERRMGWIEASLRYAGLFGIAEKKAYMHAFSLTSGMVSRDQSAFWQNLPDRGPGEAVHWQAGKLFIGENAYEDGKWPAFLPESPLYDVVPLRSWLRDTLSSRFEACQIGSRRDPLPEIMRGILEGVQKKKALDIGYFSRQNGHTRRIISPHTIIDVANRLHVRGFDHSKGRFADFVLSRILDCVPMRENEARYIGIDGDALWGRVDQVILKARARIDPVAARLDYGLDDSGVRIERVRSALLPYVVDIADESFENPVTIARLDATDTTR